ncbi:MAG: nitrate reductase [Clostridia bacterium]|nr:nitrate reductase [Clostridia bacterium]
MYPNNFKKKGGTCLETIIISFLVSVVAGVVANYIFKWLNRNDTSNQPEE